MAARMPPGAASTLGGGINSDHLYDAVAHREAIHYAAAGHVDDRFKFDVARIRGGNYVSPGDLLTLTRFSDFRELRMD
ncbi:MAG: hypothetical protein QGG54_09995, partial [Gammaproteobacteria bacterium]|nr:hypothetical protein [Gammaproteobacteria bacterium]